jgi:hypothetical protein
MKNCLTLTIVLLFSGIASTQDILSINQERQKLQRDGMCFLTSWATINIVGGSAAFFMTGDKEWKSFHEMNVYWNTVNLGLGISGLLLNRKTRTDLNLKESIRAQKKVERIFLVNSAIDLLYIGGGLAMRNYQNAKNSERMQGYGNSLILQGSFLLLFDVVEFFQHRENGYRIRPFNPNLSLSFNGNCLGLRYAIGK